jgi:hypothetical protein
VAGLLAVALLIAGCGGDSDTGTASDEAAAALSKPQFVKQANQICTQGLKEKDNAVASELKDLAASGGPPKPKDLKKMVEEAVLPPYGKMVDQLGQLGAPKGDEAKVEKLVGEFEAAMRTVEADPVKATKKNAFVAADEAAEAYGLDACRL